MSYTYSQARAGSHNVGRLTQVTSPADTLEMDYDALGRVWKQRRTFEGVTYAVQRNLDAGGYLQSTTYPDGDVVGGLTYDGAGRLAGIPGIATALTYDALGRPLTRSNTNSTQTTWSYTDPRGFLTRIHTTGPQGTVQDVQYTEHTDAGLLLRVTQPLPDLLDQRQADLISHALVCSALHGGSLFSGPNRMVSSRPILRPAREPPLLNQIQQTMGHPPAGAGGPLPVQTGKGFMYVGGSAGANDQVWGVRVMDATARYPSGYASYFNSGNQAVNPLTGQTIAPANPFWHFPLGQGTWP